MQRALLQYYEPKNAARVVKALKLTHREDLIPQLVPAAARQAHAKRPQLRTEAMQPQRLVPNSRTGKSRTAKAAAGTRQRNDRTEKWQDRSRNTSAKRKKR